MQWLFHIEQILFAQVMKKIPGQTIFKHTRMQTLKTGIAEHRDWQNHCILDIEGNVPPSKITMHCFNQPLPPQKKIIFIMQIQSIGFKRYKRRGRTSREFGHPLESHHPCLQLEHVLWGENLMPPIHLMRSIGSI